MSWNGGNDRSEKSVIDLSFEANGVTSKVTETPGKGTKVRRFDSPNLFDLQSALLYLRSQPLQDRSVQRIVVYPQTSAYLATVTVLGRERITVPPGTFNAIKFELQFEQDREKRRARTHRNSAAHCLDLRHPDRFCCASRRKSSLHVFAELHRWSSRRQSRRLSPI